MDAKIMAAIISLVGVIVIGIVNAVQNHFFRKRELSAQYISNKRVEWIQELRKYMSGYLKEVYTLLLTNARLATRSNKDLGIYNKMHETNTGSFYLLNEKAAYLHLHLNFKDEVDSVILTLVDEINEMLTMPIDNLENYQERVGDKTTLLIKHTQILLKLEWDRVKDEIKSKKISKKKMLRKTVRLYEDMSKIERVNEIEIDECFEKFRKICKY